jgi:hypothetical protein
MSRARLAGAAAATTVLASLALTPAQANTTTTGVDDVVECSIKVTGEAYDRKLWGGKVEVVGPSRIQCHPHAPSTSEMYVWLYWWDSTTQKWLPYGLRTWYNIPTTYKNVYDVSGCNRGYYKVYAWLKVCYGTCDTGSDWSDAARGVYINCTV